MDYNSASDAELRFELQKRGFPNIPITETTRKIIIKKLKNCTLEGDQNSSKQMGITKQNLRTRHKLSSTTVTPLILHNAGSEDEAAEDVNVYHQYSVQSLSDAKQLTKSCSKSSSNDYDIKKVSSKTYVPNVITAASQTNNSNSYTILNENSNVVNRLLKLRDSTIKSFISSIYSSETDGEGNITHRSALNKSQRSWLSNILSRWNFTDMFRQSSIPYFLMATFGLFFIILSLLYLIKPPDLPSTILESNTVFVTCEEMNYLGPVSPSVNCIESDIISSAISLNRDLIQTLQNAAELYYCQNNTSSPEVSGTDFVKRMYKKQQTSPSEILRSFNAAIYLMQRNPQWKISIINYAKDTLPDIYKQDIRFTLIKPRLPMMCIILQKLKLFFRAIRGMLVMSLNIVLILGLYRYFKGKQRTYLMTVDNIIKEIIKELTHNSNGKEILVTHIKNKIISNSDNSLLLTAWDEALRKLEDSDSRIQFGTTFYNGAEFRTMKWIERLPNNLQNDSHCKKKQWQSPAFENTFNCFEPPSPCLKIRHMFDFTEINQPDLKQNIIDSILEKVSSQCCIYDIELDKQSCCVYIRCASEKDAGIIYNEINGWWFNNRLVSIKFLRLQRYLARFPDATSSTGLTQINPCD